MDSIEWFLSANPNRFATSTRQADAHFVMQLQSWLHPWMWLSLSRHVLVPHPQLVWDSYTTMHWHWLTFRRTDEKNGRLLTIRSCCCKPGSNSGCGCPRTGTSCSLICSCMGLTFHGEVAVADFLEDWWDFVDFWFPAYFHDTHFFKQKNITIMTSCAIFF